jgi:flagellar biosynthesis protein FliQ
MEEIEVTWWHAIKIWWSLTWRIVLFGGLAGLALGLLLGLFGAVTGTTDDTIQFWGQIGGMLVSIPIGIWVVKSILNKDFTKYRIILVPSLDSRLEAHVQDQIPDRTDTQ